MKAISIFILALCLLISCEKEAEEEDILMEDISFELLYPIDQVIDSLDFSFVWATNSEGPVRFVLSDNENFYGTMLDTIISEQTIKVDLLYSPRKRYYYKVEVGRNVKTSSFDMVDYLANIEGRYELNATRICHTLLPDGHCDSTFVTNAIVEIRDDKLFILEKDSILNYEYSLYRFVDSKELEYIIAGFHTESFSYFDRNHSSLIFDLESDSISIRKREYFGHALQRLHNFNGVKN